MRRKGGEEERRRGGEEKRRRGDEERMRGGEGVAVFLTMQVPGKSRPEAAGSR